MVVCALLKMNAVYAVFVGVHSEELLFMYRGVYLYKNFKTHLINGMLHFKSLSSWMISYD